MMIMNIRTKAGEKLSESKFVSLIGKIRSQIGLEIVRIRSGKEISLKPIVRMNSFCQN
jgi:hypothetical protein